MDKSCRFRFWLLELRLVEANGQLDVAPIGAIGIINIPLPAIVDGRLPEAQVQCFTPPPGMDAILREPPSPISPDVLWTPPHRGTRLKVSIEKPTCQRDPVVVYWPSGFLEAWCTKAKKRHFFKNIYNGLLALPPSAAGPPNQYFPEQVWFFGLGTPGLQKTTWPINHYGIPLNLKVHAKQPSNQVATVVVPEVPAPADTNQVASVVVPSPAAESSATLRRATSQSPRPKGWCLMPSSWRFGEPRANATRLV